MMKKLLASFTAILLSISAFALSGGPDAYGYVWADSNEPGGPTFGWIDITTSGTLVSGLTDDNSIAFVPMGMNFHYYWGDFNQIKIGSNGWLGFDNTANIAHCFPIIPTGGGAADNFLAPFMSDLILNVSTAEVYYYHDSGTNQFIVSFIDAPWWNAAAPGYAGNNTFQVILSAADSSITYQYQSTTPISFNDQAGCAGDLVIGIEGPTGTLGLMTNQDVVPGNNYAIKFTYPNPVLLQIEDVAAQWNSNPQSRGEFHKLGSVVDIPINVAAVGNADITSSIGVAVTVRNSAGITQATFNGTVVNGLNAGTDSTLTFQWTPLLDGQFSVETIVTNSSDINPGNNQLTSELEIIDVSLVSGRHAYTDPGALNSGSISWTSGGGVAVYMAPAEYPFYLDSIGCFLVQTVSSNFELEVYADDGPGGSPGTLIHTETLVQPGAVFNGWMHSALATPYTVNAGGYYIGWKHTAADIAVGTVTTTPLSRQNLEYLSSFTTYRDNETTDFMMEAYGSYQCSGFTATTSNQTDVSCNGGTDGTIDVTVAGGTGGLTYSWDNGAGTNEDPTGLGAGIYTLTVTDGSGCTTTEVVSIAEPAAITTSEQVVNVACNGGSNGAAIIVVSGGTGTTVIDFSPLNQVALPPGIHSYTVTDANGCTFTDTLLITEPPLLVLSGTSTDEIAGNDGTIDLTVSGGTAPYTYSWNNGAGTSEDPTNLAGGTYTVTVTDANGCVMTLDVTVISFVGIEENSLNNQLSIYPNPSAGLFTVALTDFTNESLQLKVVDVLGKTVFVGQAQATQQLQLTESGIYFVHLVGANTQQAVRIVVQH